MAKRLKYLLICLAMVLSCFTTSAKNLWWNVVTPSFTIGKTICQYQKDDLITVSANDFGAHGRDSDGSLDISLTLKCEYAIEDGEYKNLDAGFFRNYTEEKKGWFNPTQYEHGTDDNIYITFKKKWDDKAYISADELFKKVLEKNKDANNANIRLRFTISAYYNPKGSNLSKSEPPFVFNVRIYKCTPGSISVDSKITPNIQLDDSPVYGIYNKEGGRIPIINQMKPTIFNEGSESLLYVLNKVEGTKTSNLASHYLLIKEGEENYNWNPTYENFVKEGENKIEQGGLRQVYRQFTSGFINCQSNVLTFQAVDTLSFDGFSESEIERYVCQGNAMDENSTSAPTSENDKGVFVIQGHDVNWKEIDETVLAKDGYEASFRWEYRTSTNRSWQEIPEKMAKQGKDLLIWKSFFSDASKSYDFRQVLTVGKFNRTVYASGDHNYVTVRVYKKPELKNFEVKVLPKYCAGDEINDTVLVKFNSLGGNYCSYMGEDDPVKNNFKWTYSCVAIAGLNGSREGTSLSVPFSAVAKESAEVVVTVTDGCGNEVPLVSPRNITIPVSAKPVLQSSYLDVEGGSINNSDTTSRVLKIDAPAGKSFKIFVNEADIDKVNSNYYISFRKNTANAIDEDLWDERTPIKGIGYTVSQYTQAKEWYSPTDCYNIKVVKENKSEGCVSEPVNICINYVSKINSNRIEITGATEKNEMFVCSNALSDELSGTPVTGGYNEGSYSYLWQYCSDTTSEANWVNMKQADNKFITTEGLKKDQWAKPIDKVYYVRRVAISKTTGSDETSAIRSNSNVLTIKPYKKPTLGLTVNGFRPSTLAVCYDEEVKLGTTILNGRDLGDYGQKDTPITERKYAYYKKDGSYEYSEIANPHMVRDTMVYAYGEFCGEKIYSTSGTKVTTNPNLAPAGIVTYESCQVKGLEVGLNVKVPTGGSYKIVSGNTVVENEANPKLQLPNNATDLEFTVYVTDKDKVCTNSRTEVLANSSFDEPLEHKELVVASEGAKGDNGEYRVCAGNAVTVAVANESDDARVSYTWYRDRKTMDVNLYKAKSMSTNLSDMGTAYTIVRKSELKKNNKVCQTLFDTVKVNTYSRIGNGLISANDNSVCYESQVKLTLKKSALTGGSGKYSYAWHKVTNESDEMMEVADTTIRTIAKEDASYYAVISDQTCKDEMYNYETENEAVTVEKDLTFTASATPSSINKADIEYGTEAVIIKSPEMSATDKVTVVLNSANVIKLNQNYALGITHSLSNADFIENVANYTVIRYGKNTSCSHTVQVTVTKNDGFNMTPAVHSTNSSMAVIEELCPGSKTKIYVQDVDKLEYSHETIPASQLTHQWYRHVEGQTGWALCGTSDTITEGTEAGMVTTYYCKLSYTPAGGTTQSVITNEFTVYGIKAPEVGRVSFTDGRDEKSTTYYMCKGDSRLLQLTLDKDVLKGVTYQWYEKAANATEWIPVRVEDKTTGTTSNECTIHLKNYKQNTRFKLVVTDTECSKESESENTILLVINGGDKFSEKDIYLSSSTIYNGASLDSVILTVPRDQKSSYYWTSDPTFSSSSWVEGIPAIVKKKGGFKGKDSVFVYKVSAGYGNCASDTITYHFNAYKKLTAGKIQGGEDYLCPGDGSTLRFSVNDIEGGDNDYHTDWYYKTEDMTEYSLVDATNKGLPFNTEGPKDEMSNTGGASILKVDHLKETCQFQAVIRSNGDYPGDKLTARPKLQSVYSPLRGVNIDNVDVTQCNGLALAEIIGDTAKGGSGNYAYTWIKAEMEDGKRGAWNTIADQTGKDYTAEIGIETYKLTTTTYFARVTSDKNCPGVRDTSSIKTVRVLDDIKITSDDISFTPLVSLGSVGNMWGKNEAYDYVWFDEDQMVIDTTEAHNKFATESLKEVSNTFYAKVIVKGLSSKCMSSNFDTITINTFEVDGGRLSFDNFDPVSSKAKYWICSGGKAGKISVGGSGDREYTWYYNINGGVQQVPLYGRGGKKVKSAEVNLDTCGLELGTNPPFEFSSGKELEKKISIYRTFEMQVEGSNGQKRVSSDTLDVYIVPTLSYINDQYMAGENIAGTLRTDKLTYCPGDKGEPIDGIPSANVRAMWASKNFGPYIYDEDAPTFTTWFETKQDKATEWEKGEIYEGMDYAQTFEVEEVENTFSVRRVFSDGCSSSSTKSIDIFLSDRKADISKVRHTAVTPEGKERKDCFEMGDTLYISYAESFNPCYWFADEACTDTLEATNNLLNLGALSEETPVVVYLKRRDKETQCLSTALSIPLTIYTKSDGGIIYKDQMVCSGEQFTRVVSGRKASGYSYYPSNGVKRQFSYQWQICTNLKTGVWTDIEGATDGEELTEEQLNAAILGTLKHYYVRRKAVNECGRECYSNTITLTYFDAFEGGSLSMSGKKQAFCYTDTFPTIVTSSPTGGYYGEMGYDGYSYAWELSLDGKDYTVVSPLGQQTSRQLDLDYLLRYSEQMEVDFGKKNTLYVRAQYADQCGEAYSEPLSITLWAKTEAPRIYQDKDSCNADAVTIKTYDTDKYQYTWIIIDDEGQITWSYTQDSLKVQRVTDLNVTEYGVLGMEKESGCVSDYTYFNVDSLPVLSQEALFNPYPTICYGSHFTLKGSTVSGGSGEKSYQWQISYDGEKFDDYSKEEDFEMEKMTSSMYVRRVIIDQCDNDTTNTLYLPVTKKLTAPEDLVRLDDYRCEEQLFMAYLNTELFDSLKTAYGSSFSDLRVDMTAEDGVKEAVFDSERTSTSMFGFEGARKGYSLYLVGKSDSSSMECKSAPLGITAHNISPIDDGYNVIGCQTLEPCNETIVEIVGGDATDDEESWRHISWKWYKSTDKEQWTELLLKTGQNLNLEIADTMYVKRVANNGCEIKESNILTFVGRKLTEVDYERELEMQVVTTQQDSLSSVVLTVNSAELEAFGNGEMPLLKVGKNTLPYTAEQYEDSILKLRKSGTECYSTYKVQPLRGGRISMDGDGVVCPKEAISPIVATELEGGNGEYEYQWQYRNDNVPEWVNLPGETGKSYQPMATTVRTWYRRVSKSGIYTSYSNEVSVTIAPAVKVGYIRTDKDSAYYAQYGLKLTDFSVQRTATMDMQLQAEVANATLAWWETYNATWKWWEKVTSVVDLTDSVQRMDVTDTTEQVRYRLVAINACGADTSEEFTVYTQNIPLILDEELTLEPAKCYGQDAKVYVRRPGTDYRNYRTMYSGYSGEMYILKLVNGEDVKVSVTEKDSIEAYTVYFKNVTEPFTIKATRLNIVTGASSSREIEVPFKKFEADFTYTVDGVEHDLSETDVEMQQGSLVEFHNKIENVCYYYDHNYWELIEAPNPDLAPEGARKYGLESHQVSPSCYFYNAGRYQVTYIATSWSGCKDTIVFDALHIPANAVHSMKLPIAAEFVEAGQPASVSVAEVYPSMFSDELTIRYPKKRFSYSVYASDGKSVLSGSGEDESRLQTSVLQSGVYLVEVDGWLFKVVKK